MSKPNVTKRKRPVYDDQFRAGAVLMLRSQGYPAQPGALALVAKHLKVPERTLSRWARGENNPPPDNLVSEKREDLRNLFLNEIYEIFKVLPTARPDASYGTLVTASGIYFDKIRLIDGLPTEILQVTSQLLDAFKQLDWDATAIFNDMLTKAKAKLEAERVER